MKPLALDLCCGLGGWAEGLLAAGWDVVGMDIEERFAGRYPGQLFLQDMLTFSGHRARGRVSLVVASPPCTEPSYRAMPWKRAKALNAAGPPVKFIELFNACFRIAEEIGCPVVVENVKGAQPWVGRAAWHYGSFYLWGDVPALMPKAMPKVGYGVKQHGSGADRFDTGIAALPSGSRGVKGDGGGWYGNYAEMKAKRENGEAIGCNSRLFSSKSPQRAEASAQIAKIPFDLAYHIGQVFHPGVAECKYDSVRE